MIAPALTTALQAQSDWEHLLRKHEGLSLNAYLCPAKAPTIGYGHTIPSVHTPPITLAQARTYLRTDMAAALAGVFRQVPALKSTAPNRRVFALADFIFNLGEGRFERSTLRKCVLAGDWAGASKENGRWVYGGGKMLPGLVARRAETSLWLEQG